MNNLTHDLLIYASTFLARYYWKILWTSCAHHWNILLKSLHAITLDNALIHSKLPQLRKIIYHSHRDQMYIEHPTLQALLKSKLQHIPWLTLRILHLHRVSLFAIKISLPQLTILSLHEGIIDNLRVKCPQLHTLKCKSVVGIANFLLQGKLYQLRTLRISAQLTNIRSPINLQEYTNLTKLEWRILPHVALSLECPDTLKDLYLEGVKCPLTHLTNLVRLCLSNSYPMSIPNTSSLKHLRISRRIESPVGLNLETLYAPGKIFSEYSSSLTALRKLTAYSLSVGYVTLTVLNVVSYHEIIGSLTNLTKLTIHNNIGAQQDLSGLCKLRKLNLMYDNVIYPQTVIELSIGDWLRGSNLRNLRLYHLTCKLNELSEIDTQTNLISLSLSQISGNALRSLLRLTNLKHLYIKDAPEKLPELIHLRSLRVSFLHSRDVCSISNLTGLTYLELMAESNNVRWLTKLTNLETLRTFNNLEGYPPWIRGIHERIGQIHPDI